jgi:hypothetical protein
MARWFGCVVLALALLSASASAQTKQEFWQMQGWTTDFSKTTISFDEIRDGGPPKDGIPALDDPKFAPLDQADQLSERDPVIAFSHNGDARAYPLSVLMWHEIANDTVGGKPVTITFCPLCNAAIAFDRTFEGEVLDFGTTGKLRNSDLVMYDRQSETWWQQFSGEAIIGKHAGKSLTMLPSSVMSWASFKKAFPDGTVLIPNNPEARDYGRNPYTGYDTLSAPFLYDGQLPDDIPAMSHVVVIRRAVGEDPIIVALNAVSQTGSYEVEGYRIAWEKGLASALSTTRISEGREIGQVQVTKDGEPVVHDVTFAFVAHAFHPGVAIALK